MKDKRKIILLVVTLVLALAGIIHSVAYYVYLLGCRYMSAPAEVAFFWLIPYASAVLICLTVGGLVIHSAKKN